MSAPAAPDPAEGTAAFREWQAIRCLEAATAILASPFRTATVAQINTLQTAARTAANPQLRAQAQAALDAWADREEPSIAAMVAHEGEPVARNQPANVLYFDAWKPRRPARLWDPIDTRPCDTEPGDCA